MVEVMVASVILSAGVLGVFVMVETADKVNERNRERGTATALARELLEKARPTAFSTIGTANWFDASLQATDGRTGNVTNPTTHSSRATIARRGVTYTVDVDTCSVDDVRDQYGTHGSTSYWCPDSTGTSTAPGADAQPEDLKRVAVSMGWTGRGGQPSTLYQTATFGSGGQVIGPTLTGLSITNPSGLDQNNPIITVNPTSSPAGHGRFVGTSPGAADMKFAVDGVEQPTGVTGGGGTWTFDWNVVPLKDGVYSISAVAIDALGVRGAPRVMQVRLARAAPTPPANITGGYNFVNIGGTQRTVVELMWDASPEGSVTGYEVTKPGGVVVCAASVATECMDANPATSGSTVYTIKTLYTDAVGNPQSISSTYNVTAPATGAALPTQYIVKFDGMTMPGSQSTPKCKPAPNTTSTTYQNHFDMVPRGTFNGSVWSTGFTQWAACFPVMTTGGSMAAGAITFRSRWKNSKNAICSGVPIQLYLNGTTILAQTTLPNIPSRSALTTYTVTLNNATARTFAAGDQLSLYTPSSTHSLNCSNTQMDFGNDYNGVTSAQIDVPLGGGGSGSTLTRPGPPTGLTSSDNGDGTITLTWTPPAGTPAPEFYRIYRDGTNVAERIDTAGHTTNPTISWVDNQRTASSHVYRVKTVSTVMAESDFAGPVTR